MYLTVKRLVVPFQNTSGFFRIAFVGLKVTHNSQYKYFAVINLHNEQLIIKSQTFVFSIPSFLNLKKHYYLVKKKYLVVFKFTPEIAISKTTFVI